METPSITTGLKAMAAAAALGGGRDLNAAAALVVVGIGKKTFGGLFKKKEEDTLDRKFEKVLSERKSLFEKVPTSGIKSSIFYARKLIQVIKDDFFDLMMGILSTLGTIFGIIMKGVMTIVTTLTNLAMWVIKKLINGMLKSLTLLCRLIALMKIKAGLIALGVLIKKLAGSKNFMLMAGMALVATGLIGFVKRVFASEQKEIYKIDEEDFSTFNTSESKQDERLGTVFDQEDADIGSAMRAIVGEKARETKGEPQQVPSQESQQVPSQAAPGAPQQVAAASRPVSNRLVDFIKQKENAPLAREKGSSSAYKDIGQMSIGYGTKAKHRDEVITEAEAERRLIDELQKSQNFVMNYAKNERYDWDDGKIDALTSFVYNLGRGALSQLTNNGTRTDEEIAEKLLEYNKADGKVLRGLVNRRKEEMKMFSRGGLRKNSNRSNKRSQIDPSSNASEQIKGTKQSTSGISLANAGQSQYDINNNTDTNIILAIKQDNILNNIQEKRAA